MTTKAQTSLAIVFSLIALVLMFVLDELLIGPRPIFSAGNLGGTVLFLAGMGTYAVITQYLLSRGHRHAIRRDWPVILTLNWALFVVAIISLAVEPDKVGALETLSVAIFSLALSFGGAYLAQRLAGSDGSLAGPDSSNASRA